MGVRASHRNHNRKEVREMRKVEAKHGEIVAVAGAESTDLAALSQLAEETREHIENSKAANTRRAYKSD
jgi:hypothetical protein